MATDITRFNSVVQETQRTLTRLRQQVTELESRLARLHAGTTRMPATGVDAVEGTTYVGNLVYRTERGTLQRSAPGIFRWSKALGWQGPGNRCYPDTDVEVIATPSEAALSN